MELQDLHALVATVMCRIRKSSRAKPDRAKRDMRLLKAELEAELEASKVVKVLAATTTHRSCSLSR